MLSLLISFLVLVLYAILCILVIELICWLIGLFLPVPAKIKQLLYAIVGVILIIWLVQALATGVPIRIPYK